MPVSLSKSINHDNMVSIDSLPQRQRSVTKYEAILPVHSGGDRFSELTCNMQKYISMFFHVHNHDCQ
jgi:hypothetical protein